MIQVPKPHSSIFTGLSKSFQSAMLDLMTAISTGVTPDDVQNAISANSVITQTDQTANRAFGTVYQNSSGGLMRVAVTGYYSGSNWTMQALSDSLSPLTTKVGTQSGGNALNACLNFQVPNGYFYEVTNTAAGTVESWIEWT